MSAREFTSVQKVKQLLGLTASAQDGQIQILADGVNTFVANYLNRPILSDDYVERRNGTGTNTLMLANYPVTAVASVEVGPPNTTRRLLVENIDYVWDTTSIMLVCGVFARGVANVLTSYTAGFAEMPADLAEKATKIAATRFKELDRLGQVSKAMAGEVIEFDMKDLPNDVRLVLDQYKKVISVVAQ